MNKEKKRKEPTANSSVRKKESRLWERIMEPITSSAWANAVWQEIGDAIFRRGKYANVYDSDELRMKFDPLHYFTVNRHVEPFKTVGQEKEEFEDVLRRRKDFIRETEYLKEMRERAEKELRHRLQQYKYYEQLIQKSPQLRKKYEGYLRELRQKIERFKKLLETDPTTRMEDFFGDDTPAWSTFEDWYKEKYGDEERELRTKAHEIMMKKRGFP